MLPKTNAERQREYRARRKLVGDRDTRTRHRTGQANRHITRWDTGEFVAIDGEGFSEGKEFRHVIGAKKTVYNGKDHFYAYLAASDGSDLYSTDDRISGADCLDFICSIVERNPRAIIVAFGGSYDVTHMVAHSFNSDEIKQLLGKGKDARKLDCSFGEYSYRLEYRPRKSFTIRRWGLHERKSARDPKGNWKLTPHLHAVVWDVWGFFQDSFTGVMKKWLPNDPDYKFITDMKGNRSVFDRSEIDEIRRYNAAELRCLVKIMEAVRAAINDLGLKITRWDGAGAIAAAFMQKHRVKNFMGTAPPEVFAAARCAYSGGHIETMKVGYHEGKIYHYDKNSAYPSHFRRLPALNTGRWKHGDSSHTPGKFSLVHIRFEFRWGNPFYPLFFRCDDGSILYPYRGTGWYWFPEFEAACKYVEVFGAERFEILESWSHETDVEIYPFAWVEEIHDERLRHIDEATARGAQSGPEKIIKLGENSLYGKTAQQVGARYDRDGNLKLPSYFQLEWAGYVTSGTRADLMIAALEKPHAIIAIATDGIFSTEPLTLNCPPRKILGEWEYKLHDGMTSVMPGVYWLHDGPVTKHFSRGFNKKEMSDVQFVHRAWRQKAERVPVTIERLIGLGSACMSREFWKMRGSFVKSQRFLRLDGDNSKRYPIILSRCDPSRRFVATTPRDHPIGTADAPLEDLNSAPYPISWIADDAHADVDELEGERAEEREMMDAELA